MVDSWLGSVGGILVLGRILGLFKLEVHEATGDEDGVVHIVDGRDEPLHGGKKAREGVRLLGLVPQRLATGRLLLPPIATARRSRRAQNGFGRHPLILVHLPSHLIPSSGFGFNKHLSRRLLSKLFLSK
jgi:hypothetical protein